jgi:adenylylsulfate kinase
MMESNTRSLAKAISYRLLGSATTGMVVFLWTGKLAISLGVGALDMIAKIGLYFLHERIWNHISFGRPKPPEYEI